MCMPAGLDILGRACWEGDRGQYGYLEDAWPEDVQRSAQQPPPVIELD